MNKKYTAKKLFKEITKFLDTTSVKTCLIELTNTARISNNLVITLKKINNSQAELKTISLENRFYNILSTNDETDKENSFLIYADLKAKEKEKIEKFLSDIVYDYSQIIFSASNNTLEYTKNQ